MKALKYGFQFSVKKNGTWSLVATYTCWCFLYGLHVDVVRAFCFYRKLKTENHKKKSPIPSDGTPFTIRSSRTYDKTARQVFWLSDQPEEVSLPTGVFHKSPAVAGLRLNFLRPRLQRRDRPGFAPGSGLPGVRFFNFITGRLLNVKDILLATRAMGVKSSRLIYRQSWWPISYRPPGGGLPLPVK